MCEPAALCLERGERERERKGSIHERERSGKDKETKQPIFSSPKRERKRKRINTQKQRNKKPQEELIHSFHKFP